jgi:hypothetical protein
MADICFYKLLGEIYIFPESHKGKAFCRQFPSGPVDELVVMLKAKKEQLEWRTKNYDQHNEPRILRANR